MNKLKRVSKILLFLMFSIILFSCKTRQDTNLEKQDYGIIKSFYIENEVIHWEDIENAIYYQVSYYYQDEINNRDYVFYGDEVAFLSQTKPNNAYIYPEFNIIIKVYYQDGSEEQSDYIPLNYELPNFQAPRFITYNIFEESQIYWDPCTDIENPISYTVLINGIEHLTEINSINLLDYIVNDGNNLQANNIQVKANYKEGSSVYSNIFYAFGHFIDDVYASKIEIEYDANTDENVIFELDCGKIKAFLYPENLTELPADSVFVYDTQITINKHFITSHFNADFYIITEDNHVYLVSLSPVEN